MDTTVNTSVIALEFYSKFRITPGYYVYATDMGTYNRTLNNSATLQVLPFLVLNNSKNDNKFLFSNISLRTFEVRYNSSSDISTFVLNYMDKTKPFNFATTNMTTPGNWSTLLTNDENLSCALVY